MKKLSFLVALLCVSLFTFADPELVYDVNFALASNGSSATASSGNAALAIDGNEGSRWESASTDDETWTLNMGQLRVFNTIKILWEGAFAKEFELTYSTDGENWSNLYTETNLTQAGWQEIKFDDNVTAQYIQYHGTKRATGYGQSFFEFQVLLPGVSVLTKIELSAPGIAKVGEGVALTVVAKDQNDAVMDVDLQYEITPSDAGAVVGGKYVPAKVGNASIIAKSGDVKSSAIGIFGYAGENVALEKEVEASGYDENANLYPRFAVDDNEGSLWSAVSGETGDLREYDAWIIVDLADFYDINLIAIRWEGACSKNYHVDFSADKSEWRTVINAGWNNIATHWEYLSNFVEAATKVRYVRVWSTEAVSQYGVKIMDLKVFGIPYVPSDDNEKPVMVSAELVSKTWNTAVILVDATDNDEVARYHVVDATNAIDAKCVAEDGLITVTGLSAATAYNFTITAIDMAQNESENSKEVAVTTDVHLTEPAAAAAAPTWDESLVKAIYSPTYNANCGFGEWGSGSTVADTEFGKLYTVGNGYFGIVDFALNCMTMEKLHFDFWVDDNTSARVVPIWGGAEQGVFVNLVGQQWNSIDIDLSEYTGITDWSNIYQVKIDNAANGLKLWMANAYFYRESALVDDEIPTDVTATLTSASYYHVWIAASAKDNSGVVNYVVMDGDKELATVGGTSGKTVNIKVAPLAPNTEYNLSVIAKDDAGNAAEAVAVQATTVAAPAAAPRPSFLGKSAVPVFCDELDGNPAISFGTWGQSTIANTVELAEGDHAIFGANFNYLGWELTPAVDATDMEALHVDFFTPNVTSIQLTPISPGKEGVYSVQLTAGEWTSVDVPLSAYDGKEIVWSNIFQFKFMEASPAGGELFIDNVYFYKSTTETGVDNIRSGVNVQKFIENGALYILRDGVVYTVQGAAVR